MLCGAISFKTLTSSAQVKLTVLYYYLFLQYCFLCKQLLLFFSLFLLLLVEQLSKILFQTQKNLSKYSF